MKKNMFDNEKKLNKGKVVKTIIFVLLIGIIISMVVLYKKNENFREILDKYLFRKETFENNLPYIEIDSSKTLGIYAYSKYICVLQGNKLELYNKFGKSEGSLELEISSPIFKSNGNNLLIAEKDGQKLYSIYGKNIVWQKDIEGKISNINVNRNGYVTVTILGTSYKTVVKTFDDDGNELFTKYHASTNVVAADISNDNKYLAIAETNFSGIVVQSTIKVISIEDAKNNTGNSIKYTHIANSGDLIVNIKYQSKNNLVCMYDEHIDVLNGEQNTELVNFKDEYTLFADVNFSSKVLRIVRNSTGIFNVEAQMQIIDTNTKNATTYSMQSTPKSIIVKDDIIAVDLGTSALFIKDSGWLQKKYESSHEIQNIILGSELAGIISKNKIELISF